MSGFFIAVGIGLALMIGLIGYRVVVGPTLYDRLIAAGVIGTNTLLLLIMIGFIYGRIDMFIDLAIVYAMLNFVGVITAGKYLQSSEDRG